MDTADSAAMLSKRRQRDEELDRRIEALRRKNQALVKRYQEVEDDKKKAAEEDEGHGEEEEGARSGVGQTEDLTITIEKSSRQERRTVVTKPGGADFGARGDGSKLGSGRGNRRKLLVTMAGNNNNKRVVSETPQIPCPVPMERSVLIGNGGHQRAESEGRHRPSAAAPITKDSEHQYPGASSPLAAAHMTLISSEEHQEYLRWKRERDAIDRERVARHKNSQGQWRRAWDVDKTESMFPKRDHDTACTDGKTGRRGHHKLSSDQRAHQPERRVRDKAERGVITASMPRNYQGVKTTSVPRNDQGVKTASIPRNYQGLRTASTTAFDQGVKTTSAPANDQGVETTSAPANDQGVETTSAPANDQGVKVSPIVKGGRRCKKAPVTSSSKAQGKDRLTGRARRWDAAEEGDSPETLEPSLEAFMEELDDLTNTVAHSQKKQPSAEPPGPDIVPDSGAAEGVEVRFARSERKGKGQYLRGTEKKVWFPEELVQGDPVHRATHFPLQSPSPQGGASPGPAHLGAEAIQSLEDRGDKPDTDDEEGSSSPAQNQRPDTVRLPGSSLSDDRGIHPDPSLISSTQEKACFEQRKSQEDKLLPHIKSEPDVPPPIPEPTGVEVVPAELFQNANSKARTTGAPLDAAQGTGQLAPAHSSSPGQV